MEEEDSLPTSLEQSSLVEQCCLETIKLLVSLGGEYNAENNFGVSPLCIAAYFGNIRLVRFGLTAFIGLL